jgi:hypothetical protein
MKTRQKILLGLAVVLILLGFLGLTETAQRWLRGPDRAGETGFDRDDRYMGAGLAPAVYLIAPGVILGVIGAMDAAVWLRKSKRNRLG